jgi:16S rRNA (adenine1518-N6/adenine1519-N6)-dimethyltransferase
MMKAAGVATQKSLGQHFLFDMNITDKIARAIPGLEQMNVVEIGPGAGPLSRSLLRCGAKSLTAVEKDRRMLPILERIKECFPNMTILEKDALKLNREFYENIPMPRAIAGNLPYNVGTELLVGWLHDSDLFASMTLMFQKEVAERIVAKPGSKKYGRLSVLAAMKAEARILFPVARTAFNPPPKVENAVVRLIPHGKYPRELCDRVERASSVLFANRRKMIRSALPGFDWASVGLSGAERAETLTLETLISIANHL